MPLPALAGLCILLLSTACGDDSGDDPLTQADSAVNAPPDASTPLPTGQRDAAAPPVGPPIDAAVPPPLDAGSDTMDAGSATLPDASNCEADATPYTCACAADPTKCAHPLQGRYAVRTISYARQKTTAAGQAVDVVSKGVLLSLADISATGEVKEQLCFLEIVNPDGMYSWITPAASQRIPGSTAKLEERAGGFVRTRAADQINVSWSRDKQPADCTPNTTHSTGCACYPADTLPSDPKDCRVTDLDEDGKPGLKLSVGFERPVDPTSAVSLLGVSIAGVKAVEWRLPGTASAKLVGDVEGSVEQNQLSVEGEFASELGKVKSANCPSDVAHVELVRGEFDCAKLMAGRATDIDGHGIFDAKLDGERPAADACIDPDCAADSDKDGTPDCKDACPLDAAKLAAGTCGCGVPETNTDGDTALDCLDECDADAAKTAAGVCGCGVPETNADGDAQPDCLDECDADAAKTAAGVCGCGVVETNTDGDSLPDCTDACDADPAKTVAGVCGCGVSDADTDADGTLDCNETCDNDKLKTVPGQCGCGVADADLNGDGTIDCMDLCPADPAKVAPGACGCGVPDTNTDGDAQLDCLDECDTDPAKVVAGTCGCGVAESVCNSPLLGTYALRSVIHARQRIGNDAPTTSRAISYGLVTFTNAANGALAVSETTCWVQSLPNPSESGTAVYSWSKPAWVQAAPPTIRTATANANGSWSAPSTVVPLGWDPARQPTACSASATPPSGWPGSWGSTCTCRAPASTLPAYDRDGAPYDCRLTDADGDGFPGVSAYVSTSAPSSPDQDASGLLSGRAFAASTGGSRWTLTPAADGRHTGTIADETSNNLVGCTGGACLGLGAVAPTARSCPENLNTLQFVPTTAGAASCAEIVAQRATLFSTSQDKSWAEAAACPSP